MYTLADAHLDDSKYMALGPVSVYTLANAQGYVSRTHREQMHYPKAMYAKMSLTLFILIHNIHCLKPRICFLSPVQQSISVQIPNACLEACTSASVYTDIKQMA